MNTFATDGLGVLPQAFLLAPGTESARSWSDEHVVQRDEALRDSGMKDPPAARSRHPWTRWSSMVCIVAVATACERVPPSGNPKMTRTVPELQPRFASEDDHPEAVRYAGELSYWNLSSDTLPVADRKPPAIPSGAGPVPGTVLTADHNSRCSFWTIHSYAGSNWMEDQSLHVYAERRNERRDLTEYFDSKVIDGAFSLAFGECETLLVVASVAARRAIELSDGQIWTLDLARGELTILDHGHSPKPSPDHRMAAYWKSDDFGFHCLYVWSPASAEPTPVLSMWESDRMSGTSWDWGWSSDSQAIVLRGDCSGFLRASQSGGAFTLVYLVKSGTMVRL